MPSTRRQLSLTTENGRHQKPRVSSSGSGRFQVLKSLNTLSDLASNSSFLLLTKSNYPHQTAEKHKKPPETNFAGKLIWRGITIISGEFRIMWPFPPDVDSESSCRAWTEVSFDRSLIQK